MDRIVEPEALDALSADDPMAQRSRCDLANIHRIMGTVSILQAGLQEWGARTDAAAPLKILEVGAGDGTLMLRVAKRMSDRWPKVELTLLDRLALISPETVAGFNRLGWTVTSATVDIEDWAERQCNGSGAAVAADPPEWHIVIANLFLHHFSGATLSTILRAVALSTDHFFACEPRRSYLALGASHLVGAIGANAVTRQDAVLSVRAGFCCRELSAAWRSGASVTGILENPGVEDFRDTWQLSEYSAGLFSHCMKAQRRQRV